MIMIQLYNNHLKQMISSYGLEDITGNNFNVKTIVPEFCFNVFIKIKIESPPMFVE